MSERDPQSPAPATEAVFAYGSNMDLDDLAVWLAAKGYPVERPRFAPAVLPGWRLVWNYTSPTRRGGAANIEPAPGHDLPGAVLWVGRGLLRAIDHKEGHPERYRRQRLTVQLEAGPLEVWAYVVTPAWRTSSESRPRRVYVETIVRGARMMGLPEAHIAALAATRTLEDDG